MNTINVIAPYKYHGQWVFDDPRVGLSQRAFCCWRRIVYFLTLFSSIYLVGLPWLVSLFSLSTKKSLPGITAWITRRLEPLFTIVGYMVPDWVERSGSTPLTESQCYF
jgi:hypothetical protein